MKWMFILLLFSCHIIAAQNTIGTPNIINYAKQTYHAGNQNWGIAQDKDGIMYFANNNGLLSFDGAYWRTYELPNKTIVRSVAIANDGKIYVGGQQELGFFLPDASGELQYHSLIDLLPTTHRDFADIWGICIDQKNNIFFRSNRKLFCFSANKFDVYEGVNWRFIASTGMGVIAYEFSRGLVHFSNHHWIAYKHQSVLPPNVYIRAAVDGPQGSTLLSTFENGVYKLSKDSVMPFTTPDLTFISTKKIYGCCQVAADKLAFITSLAGCIITDTAGRTVQHISKQEGVQTNNILSIFLDRDKNLWLGLDNGIDLVTYNNAIKNIFPDPTDKNAGYASIVYRNHLYVGVSTGLYCVKLDSNLTDLSFSKGSFVPVANMTGRLWSLSEVNGMLLAGHNNGGYLVEGNKATLIDGKTGVWSFQKLDEQNPASSVIAGTYNGIDFYENKAGKLTTTPHRVAFESARFIVKEGNTLLVAHPYKGLYKLNIETHQESTAIRYTPADSFLSVNHNHLFRIKGKIILTSDKGIFEYNGAIQKFEPALFLTKLFSNKIIHYLKEDPYGNIWFSESNKMGVIDMTTSKPQTIYLPELDNKMQAGGFENINVLDSNNVLIAGEQGFFHLNYAKYKKEKQPLQVLIRKASLLEQDSLLFGGFHANSTSTKTLEIAYNNNSIHFEFSSTRYSQSDNITFSFYLKGFDKQWSEWVRRNEKDYTNLPAGQYTFYVKCRSNTGNESAAAAWSFTVLPPWYQTSWAYVLFALLFASITYLFYKTQQRKYIRRQQQQLAEQQRRYAEEQKQQAILHQLEIGENEKRIIQLNNAKLQAEVELEKNERELANLRNEKLQNEVEHKNSELASSAMSLVRKMEVLTRLKDDLHQYKTNTGSEKGAKDFQKIIRLIDEELDHASDWEKFAVHFDNVHTNYLKKLKELYPDLTASELKLSAYLRLNLSTKEIAQLMNISIRGVETSRYRLRKKMDLSNEVNLFDHLITVTK